MHIRCLQISFLERMLGTQRKFVFLLLYIRGVIHIFVTFYTITWKLYQKNYVLENVGVNKHKILSMIS